MSLRIASLVMLLPLLAAAQTVTLPHTFVDGTVASADDVNANFAALAGALNGQSGRTWSTTGFVASGAELTLTLPVASAGATVLVFERRRDVWQLVEPTERGRLLGDPALLGYWPFDETSGAVAQDLSTRGRNLALADNHTLGQEGTEGTGLRLGGTGSSGGGFGTNTAFGGALGGGLTLAVWMHPFENNRDIHFFTLDRSGASHDVYFSFYPAACGAARLSLRGDVTGGQCSTASIPLNTWTHVAATYDQLQREVRVYVNGVLDSIHSNVAMTFSGLTMNFVRLGGRFSGHGYDFIGRFDDAVVVSRVLGADEIQSLHLQGVRKGGYAITLAGQDVALRNDTGVGQRVRLVVLK